MTNLDRAWWAWRALSRTEKAQFLTLFREAYARDRAAVRRKNGHAVHGARVESLTDLTVTATELGLERRW
ncbi:hypothetical protein ACVJGD_001043 [Bradyrhizobium sp. USDA 10063]